MKKLKVLLVGIMAVIAMIAAAPEAGAQDLLQARKQVVVMLQNQLPQVVEEGMTWTNCTLSNDGKTINWTFDINPVEMGVSLEDAKTALKSLIDTDEFKAILLSDELKQVMTMLDCNLNITFVFPDKTSYKNLLTL